MPSAAELERLFRLVIDPLCIAGLDGYLGLPVFVWVKIDENRSSGRLRAV